MKKINEIALNSLLASLSLILAQISHYLKIIPGVPMITLDFSNIPIFVSTLLFGSSGYIILILVSAIRCLLFSSAGWPGAIARILVTSVVILFLNLYKKSRKHFWMFSALASIFSTLVKLPINYFFWTKFFSMSYQYVNSILFSVVLPANIIQVIVTTFISNFIYIKSKTYT